MMPIDIEQTKQFLRQDLISKTANQTFFKLNALFWKATLGRFGIMRMIFVVSTQS